MHGRVLLTPLFCLLMPVAVIPVVLPDGTRFTRETGYLLAAATSVLWASVVGWSIWAANSSGLGADGTRVTYSGIVDERQSLPCECPRVVEYGAPQHTRFPISGVTRVVAKAEKDGERQTDQRERHERQMHFIDQQRVMENGDQRRESDRGHELGRDIEND